MQVCPPALAPRCTNRSSGRLSRRWSPDGHGSEDTGYPGSMRVEDGSCVSAPPIRVPHDSLRDFIVEQARGGGGTKNFSRVLQPRWQKSSWNDRRLATYLYVLAVCSLERVSGVAGGGWRRTTEQPRWRCRFMPDLQQGTSPQ
jgi:hypothetical protein